MLRLIIGRAGAGKTGLIIDEIRRRAASGESGLTLLVPEQYSHEAERELCAAVGESLSLHACVLSFTGLYRRLREELGGKRTPLDKGGRLLCMALALSAVGPRLRLYGAARRSPELQLRLLSAVDELKSACVTPEALEETADKSGGSLGLKLSDLALVLEAYDAAVGAERADPADALTLLLSDLPRSGFGREGRIYVDGFTDFTAQEFAILRALIARGADMTVCLTCDALEGGSEVFELSRRTARALMREAESRGVDCALTQVAPEGEASPLSAFADRLFTYTGEKLSANGAVSLFSADTVTAECELAAARCVQLCRDSGARWRDIAVAVRGFEDYRPALEAAFAYYGAPLFTARKSDIAQKPLPALISAAYEIPAGGWEPEEVAAYLRTGLAGLDAGECDILENYLLLWGCKSAQWLSDRDWRMHPDGYGGAYDESALARLSQINALRRRVAGPLLGLAESSARAVTGREQAAALAGFMDELRLPAALSARADALEASGRPQAAAEVERLWDLTVSALEQACSILGGTELSGEAFARLFLLTLSQYDVGLIPVSLDMVSAGDMDRMRRRNIKHLLVLGASDERLPAAAPEGGVFTDEERRLLTELGLPLDAGDAELWREYSLIYNCLSLPSDSLTLVAPAFASDGGESRPSFVVNRAARLFSLPILPCDARLVKSAAPGPAMELAAAALRPPCGALEAGALAYFSARDGARLRALESAAAMTRGRLSPEAVRSLYGEKLRLSASRIDAFASCRFSYFLKYGLKAKPREPAQFSPPQLGTFMHYVLQHAASEAQALGGFGALGPGAAEALADKYVEKYITEELHGFEGQSRRFIYLFRRLSAGVRRIVADMAEELKASDFTPLDFELDFGKTPGIPELPLPEGGSLRLTGIADRVDGWVRDGRLYLRVIDYKTGRKSFSLSDVRCGMGLQMLLYLYTLEKCGEERYGLPVSPAGVLYVPARDPLLSADGDLSDEELSKKRASGLRRSGLLLSDPEALFAMEKSEAPLRLPVKWKDGVPSGEALASAERLGLLGRSIEDTLRAMAGELKRGSIAADPYYKAAQDNACLYCDYAAACRLRDGEDGDKRRYIQKLPATRVWNILEGGERNG